MTAPRWIETGTGPRGLVFLHGVSGGAKAAATILPAITPPGWRGLAWDMPGYGASPARDPLDFDVLADAVRDLLDAAGLAQAVLVGHSMGGMIALQTAVRHPARVSGLVLACCTPAFGAPAGPLQQAFLARRTGPLDEGATMRDVAIELIPTMVGPDADPEFIHTAVDVMGDIPPDSYRAAMRALVRFDQRAGLASIDVPALVVAGVHDQVAQPPVVRRMADALRARRFVALDAGHMGPFEAPEAFAGHVHRFLADHIPVT